MSIAYKELHWSEPPIKTQLGGIILSSEIKFQEERANKIEIGRKRQT